MKAVRRKWVLGPTSDVYNGTKPPGPGWKPLTDALVIRWRKEKERKKRKAKARATVLRR